MKHLVLSRVSLVDSLIMKARTSSSVTSGSFSSFFSLLAPHGMLVTTDPLALHYGGGLVLQDAGKFKTLIQLFIFDCIMKIDRD